MVTGGARRIGKRVSGVLPRSSSLQHSLTRGQPFLASENVADGVEAGLPCSFTKPHPEPLHEPYRRRVCSTRIREDLLEVQHLETVADDLAGGFEGGAPPPPGWMQRAHQLKLGGS